MNDNKLDHSLGKGYIFSPVPEQSKGISIMREVIVRKGEPIDRALKRLKTKLDVEGIIDEMKRRKAFETPMDERRRKARSASKRNKVKWRFVTKTQETEALETPVTEA